MKSIMNLKKPLEIILNKENQGSQKHYKDIVFNFEYICRWSTLEFHKIRTTVNSKNISGTHNFTYAVCRSFYAEFYCDVRKTHELPLKKL